MSTPVELQRAKEQQLAATREALAKVLWLQAAIEALCERKLERAKRSAHRVEPQIDIGELRALVADGGREALREHGERLVHKILNEVMGTIPVTEDGYARIEEVEATIQRVTGVERVDAPYRDTAGEAGS